MKSRKLHGLLFILLLFSCNKEDQLTPIVSIIEPANYVSFDINGQSFTLDNTWYADSEKHYDTTITVKYIAASDLKGDKTIALYLLEFDTGDFIGGDYNHSILYAEDPFSPYVHDVHGEKDTYYNISVSFYDSSYIKGTFDCRLYEGYDSLYIDITNGEFQIDLTQL